MTHNHYTISNTTKLKTMIKKNYSNYKPTKHPQNYELKPLIPYQTPENTLEIHITQHNPTKREQKDRTNGRDYRAER